MIVCRSAGQWGKCSALCRRLKPGDAIWDPRNFRNAPQKVERLVLLVALGRGQNPLGSQLQPYCLFGYEKCN